jgi:hypothetical protein
MAIGDSPVLEPYSQGSTTLLISNSRPANRAMAISGFVQPGSPATAMMIGMPAATAGPT